MRYFSLLVFVVLLAGLFAQPIWSLYVSVYPESGGSWIDLHAVAAMMLGYALFLPFVFLVLGNRHKYWHILFFYIPIIFFEFSSNFYGFFLFTGIGTVGFLAGWLVRYLVTQTLGKTPRFEPMKKYF